MVGFATFEMMGNETSVTNPPQPPSAFAYSGRKVDHLTTQRNGSSPLRAPPTPIGQRPAAIDPAPDLCSLARFQPRRDATEGGGVCDLYRCP